MKTQDYLFRLNQCLNKVDKNELYFAVELIKSAWSLGQQIICFGNGGSALTAKHYITDWNKGIYLATGRPFYGHCLTDNIGTFSAYANDFSYEEVFAAQLKPIIRKDDLVIGISGSGNSKNVLCGIEYANQSGAKTLGICGYNGGQLRKISKNSVLVPIDDMQIVEDIHMVFGHLVFQEIAKEKASMPFNPS